MLAVHIGVIGAGQCSSDIEKIAEDVGREIAKHRAILVCGGLGGVMEASARGAKMEGGTTVGILPDASFKDANAFIDIPIVTGLSHARNVVVVRSSHVLIAIAGGYGTLSEIAIALKLKKPVVGVRTWDVSEDILVVESPYEAVENAMRICER